MSVTRGCQGTTAYSGCWSSSSLVPTRLPCAEGPKTSKKRGDSDLGERDEGSVWTQSDEISTREPSPTSEVRRCAHDLPVPAQKVETKRVSR